MVGTSTNTSTTNYQDQNADVSGDLLGIGKANFGVEAPNFFNGTMDEFTVYQRALADYEVANLHGYGFGTWQTATFDSGSWRYTIPDGENGIEGLFQINVRGTDALGNMTPLGGQRVWRGEIDTKPPALDYSYTTGTSGSKDSTTYLCSATDFNLVQDTTCLPGILPPRPTFGPGNMTLTPYAETDEWYAKTFTDTARLYGQEASLVDTRSVIPDQTMTACDAYNNCSEVGATALPAAEFEGGGEVLDPSTGTAITSMGPVTIGGDAYADSGLPAQFSKGLINDPGDGEADQGDHNSQ